MPVRRGLVLEGQIFTTDDLLTQHAVVGVLRGRGDEVVMVRLGRRWNLAPQVRKSVRLQLHFGKNLTGRPC
jgi:hypothetical protein